MNITDELERLARLHADGSLNDEEFQQAKANLLSEPLIREPRGQDRTLGEAANRYVTFRMVTGAIGLIIALIFIFGVVLPKMNDPFGSSSRPVWMEKK